MLSKIKSFFASAKVRIGSFFALLFFSNAASAADWDTTAIVKTITDGAAIVIAIGTAILGVVVLTFGFRMAKSMLKSG